MPLLEDFSSIFAVPDFIKPYLHFFATEEEMQLVVMLAKDSLSIATIAARLSRDEAAVAGFLEQAYQRYILNKEVKETTVYYSVSDFYHRLKNFCLFGNYHIIPRRVRKELDAWDFTEYLKRNDYFRKVIDASPEYDDCHNEWILLLHEVEEMIDAASVIRVLPCDCKMLADNCDHSREICLVFDGNHISDRSGGRELSKEEAKKLVHKLDREGLMHTGGPPNWQETGSSVVCNCCTCCCYPFRAAKHLGTKGKWPKSRYIAVYNSSQCCQCGLCVSRCGFSAFAFDGTDVEKDGKVKKNVSFNPELCWGCGICANACPAQAIRLVKISGGQTA
ncbi:ATP-binding protein [Sporomusa termitida]|uniref:4Fe-4S binding domain protein n=1 Tax=Sporomusa termitida TaxID=2377 RepID=A0A517DPJ0_9FIRM|nr:4Fe-4S binding protein [Sporomusa termitida]QDR79280.1 4Fe-4S binding domain protein [Sporomusa termitida]